MKTLKAILATLTVAAMTASLSAATEAFERPAEEKTEHVRPVIRGDINLDGQVNVLDMMAIIAAWGEYKGDRKAADLSPERTGDNMVDTRDLLVVLSNYGA